MSTASLLYNGEMGKLLSSDWLKIEMTPSSVYCYSCPIRFGYSKLVAVYLRPHISVKGNMVISPLYLFWAIYENGQFAYELNLFVIQQRSTRKTPLKSFVNQSASNRNSKIRGKWNCKL